MLTAKAAEYNVTNEGGVGGKIRLLKNIPGMWLLQECRGEWAGRGMDHDYAGLTSMAEGVGAWGGVMDLDDPAFSTVGDMPAKIVAHCQRTGLAAPVTLGSSRG